MGDKRGFHFLVGIATLWFLWRLYAAGIIFQAVAYMLGPDAVACYCDHGPVVSNGPGAIIVAFVIEAVITVGWVVTLTVSGIWDGLLVLGRFIGDGFGAAHSYVVGAQAEAEQVAKASEELPVHSDIESVPLSLETRLRLVQILGQKQGKTPEQIAIEQLSLQLEAVAAKVPQEDPPKSTEVAE